MTLINILKNGLKDFYNNSIVVIPALLLLIFLFIFSELSARVNYNLNSNFLLTIWLVFFGLVSLLIISFFLSGLIGTSLDIVKRKKLNFYKIFSYSKKFWFKNFIIMLVILASYNIVSYIAREGASFIGRSLELAVEQAAVIFFFIYFLGLAGGIVFLTFSSFYLVLQDKGVLRSIKSSISLVRKQYIFTFVILVSFFAINSLLELTGKQIIGDIINLFLVPYFSLLMARIIIESK